MICKVCNKEVTPEKSRFNWLAFVLWTLFTYGIGGLCYILYHFTKKNDTCPVCSQKVW